MYKNVKKLLKYCLYNFLMDLYVYILTYKFASNIDVNTKGTEICQCHDMLYIDLPTADNYSTNVLVT